MKEIEVGGRLSKKKIKIPENIEDVEILCSESICVYKTAEQEAVNYLNSKDLYSVPTLFCVNGKYFEHREDAYSACHSIIGLVAYRELSLDVYIKELGYELDSLEDLAARIVWEYYWFKIDRASGDSDRIMIATDRLRTAIALFNAYASVKNEAKKKGTLSQQDKIKVRNEGLELVRAHGHGKTRAEMGRFLVRKLEIKLSRALDWLDKVQDFKDVFDPIKKSWKKR